MLLTVGSYVSLQCITDAIRGNKAAFRNWSHKGVFSLSISAPDLKVDLGVGFHILPKGGIWLQKWLLSLPLAEGLEVVPIIEEYRVRHIDQRLKIKEERWNMFMKVASSKLAKHKILP
jgi:hypothetical protein